VFTRPEELSDKLLVDVLGASWDLRVDDVEYAAVGFGSHHWQITAGGNRWFVTVDDLATKHRSRGEPTAEAEKRLSAALETAWLLRESGMDAVVAPIRSRSGSVLETVGSRFAIAVYPFVEGATHIWGRYPDRAERLAVLDVLVQLHATTGPPRSTARIDDLTIDHRDELDAALADLDHRWVGCPFSEPARALVARHADAIRGVLEHRDRLAAIAGGRPERMVLTHGEPHRGNTITTASGVALIDWDTVLVAPPERDLWSLVAEETLIADDYEARTGVTLREDILELYTRSWDLAEIAIYTGEFRQPHAETEDTRTAWEALEHHLDPARW
jgi:spectinomycin phosphotransferase